MTEADKKTAAAVNEILKAPATRPFVENLSAGFRGLKNNNF